MKAVIRTGFFSAAVSLSARSLTLNPNPIFSHSFPRYAVVSRFPVTTAARCCTFSAANSTPMAAGGEMSSPTAEKLEKQFEDFRNNLEGSGNLRDRIRAVASEIESTTRLMYSSLLLVHQTRPVAEIVEKTKGQIELLRELFSKLAEIIRESPGQYYRYHGDWRSETQSVVSMLAFMHWLETGALLLHAEAEATLGLSSSEFGLDIEDYLVGICFMSNELPRYVVNQVTAGDYDCPRKVLKFLTELHASFRMLNLRNDFLRKKFDGMKYDLRKVEEVFYDVKIRGLASNGAVEGAKEQ